MIGQGITRISPNRLTQSAATLQVDVIADLACPWSYIGKKRLDAALHAVHGPSQVSWFPYQINPDMPRSGMALDEYLSLKFGDPASLQPAMDQLSEAGLELGIDFRFDRIVNVPNTLNAHRLMNLAESQEINCSDLADQILGAFFSHGQDISDPDILAELGSRVGIAAKNTMLALTDDRTRDIVLSQEAQVRQSGVSGVPDFLINKRLFVVGAQKTENLVNVFDRAMFQTGNESLTSASIH